MNAFRETSYVILRAGHYITARPFSARWLIAGTAALHSAFEMCRIVNGTKGVARLGSWASASRRHTDAIHLIHSAAQ